MSLTSKYWLIICVFIVALICYQIDESSNKKYYRGRLVEYENGRPEEFNFSVSICYPLNPKKNFCKEEEIEKSDCNFSRQLSCYGKSPEHKNEDQKKTIKSFFETCKLHELMPARQMIDHEIAEQNDFKDFHDDHHHDHGDSQQQADLEKAFSYEINEEDEICTTYSYARIKFRKSIFRFFVKYKHHQLFRVFTRIKLMNDSHSHGHGHKRMVFARHCHRYDVDFENCFHNEAREYELSITRLNLYTEDRDYRRACCTESCKGSKGQIEQHVKNELNRSGIDCSECAIYCSDDSWQYAFDIDRYKVERLANNSDHSDLSLKFSTDYTQLETKAKPDDYGVFLLKIFYACFLLNVNVYSLLKLALNYLLSSGQLKVPNSIDPFKLLRQIIKLILVIGFFVKLTVFLTLNKWNVQYLLEPLFEDDNISVTICFDPMKISKNAAESDPIAVENSTLGKIDQFTWNENDFVDKVSITTPLKTIIVQASEIQIFYKDLLKCFNYNYNEPTLIQFASLMRSSVLEIRIQDAEFEFFYVQPPHLLPTSRLEKQRRFLLYKKKLVVRDENCVADFWAKTRGSCRSHQDCLESCMMDEYIDENKRLSRFSRIDKSRFQGNVTLLDMRFSVQENKTDFAKFRHACAKKFPQKGCNFTTIISLHHYNFIPANLIQINLNPEYEYREKTSENSFHTFYLFPYIHLITSFSLSGYFKPKMKLLKNWTKAIIYAVYLTVFLVLIRLTINRIIEGRLESSYYIRYEEHLELPRITICWNITLAKFEDRSVNELEAAGLYPSDIIRNITYLNSNTYEYQSLDARNITAGLKGNYSAGMNLCYWLNKRCVETNLKESYRRTRFKHNREQMVFEIEVDSSLISNEQVSVFLNSDNYLTNELEFIARRNYHYHLTYTVKYSIREDDFLYFRSPTMLLNRWFYSDDPKEQDDYYIQITSLFYEQQAAATSHLPIRNREAFAYKIKDRQFLNYAHLRTLSSTIDDYSFNANFNRKLINFAHRFRYQSMNTSIITLAPNFICSFNYKHNRSGVLSLTLVLLSITATFFNVSLVAFPSLVRFWFRSLRMLLKQLFALTVLLSLHFLNAKRRLFAAMECRS